MNNEKTVTEAEMTRMLTQGQVQIPPLSLTCMAKERIMADGRRVDACVEAQWGKRRYRFAVEMKAMSTPMAFRACVQAIKAIKLPPKLYPMIMLPYLSAGQLEELEREGVSGVDLCGNGIVMVPDQLSVFRTGQPNQYSSSAPIKNIYRNNSSMVPRVFLAQPGFDSVTDVLSLTQQRNLLVKYRDRPSMAMGTVSKVIKTLEEDLIVSREKERIELVQADKLLDKLLDNFRPEKPGLVMRRRITAAFVELPAILATLGRELKLPIIATGLGSVNRYAIMQRGDLLSIYCPDPDALMSRLSVNESDRFPNLEIIPSEDEVLYFDGRVDEETGFTWASPVQTYLEMMRGDKRDQEMAAQVRALVLRQSEVVQ